jgi:hypothetical protein
VTAFTALAFELDTAKDASIYTTAGAIVLALAAVWLVKQVVTKVLTVAILLAIAGLVWTQRTELTDCADEVRASWTATATTGLTTGTECTFFGQAVTIPGRPAILTPDSATTTTVAI